jgi:hypothetical protein
MTQIIGPGARRLYAQGQGTCFFFSVLQAIDNDRYNALDAAAQFQKGLQLRRDIGISLTPEVFINMFGADTGHADEEENAICTDYRRTQLLHMLNDASGEDGNERQMVDIYGFQVTMKYLNINILVFDSRTGTFECPQRPQSMIDRQNHKEPGPGENFVQLSQDPFQNDRPTVMVVNVGSIHFEPIFIRSENGDRQFVLPVGDPLVAKMLAMYPSECEYAMALNNPFISMNMDKCIPPEPCQKGAVTKAQMYEILQYCGVWSRKTEGQWASMLHADICAYITQVHRKFHTSMDEFAATFKVTPAAASLVLHRDVPGELRQIRMLICSHTAIRNLIEDMQGFSDNTGVGWDTAIADLKTRYYHLTENVAEVSAIIRELHSNRKSYEEISAIMLVPHGNLETIRNEHLLSTVSQARAARSAKGNLDEDNATGMTAAIAASKMDDVDPAHMAAAIAASKMDDVDPTDMASAIAASIAEPPRAISMAIAESMVEEARVRELNAGGTVPQAGVQNHRERLADERQFLGHAHGRNISKALANGDPHERTHLLQVADRNHSNATDLALREHQLADQLHNLAIEVQSDMAHLLANGFGVVEIMGIYPDKNPEHAAVLNSLMLPKGDDVGI